MSKDKKFEILMRRIAQVNNLAHELQINLDFPCRIAARSVISGFHKQNVQELAFILARPKGLVQ